MATRTISIVCHDANNFDVFEGEAYAPRLCWDEMLGQVARLTGGVQHYPMQTPDGHAERADRMREANRRRNEEIAK